MDNRQVAEAFAVETGAAVEAAGIVSEVEETSSPERYPNRFKPGKSGNPAGRPKKSREEEALLEQLKHPLGPPLRRLRRRHDAHSRPAGGEARACAAFHPGGNVRRDAFRLRRREQRRPVRCHLRPGGCRQSRRGRHPRIHRQRYPTTEFTDHPFRRLDAQPGQWKTHEGKRKVRHDPAGRYRTAV